MSFDAGPGRTGIIFDIQRFLLDMAGTASTVVFHSRTCDAGLSGMDCVASAAIFANTRR